MDIGGLQKLTLLDYPGEVACTVFLKGCNLRCPFCHNGDLVLLQHETEKIAIDGVMNFLKKRRRVLDGVCISGGEPLMYPETAGLIQKIKNLGYRVKMDTNGTFPERLKSLTEAGLLDYVAMDIKNSPDSYEKTVGVEHFCIDPVKESAEFLLSGAVDYEFRTTVVKEFHQKEDFRAIGQWLAGAKRYRIQCFEDSEYVIRKGLHPYTRQELEEFLNIAKQTIPDTQLRGV